MTVRGRDTLKEYFGPGQLPTAQHFAELVDSMLHMEDEGFRRSDEHGLHVTSASGEKALVTFFRKEFAREPQWTIRYGGLGGQLNLHPGGGVQDDSQALLSLDARRRVGVATTRPQHALDVNGFVGATGRTGTAFVPDPARPPLADGEWHVVADRLSGCVAFEVVASASKPGEGRHAVMHAFALNAHNPSMGRLERWFDGWFVRRLGRRKRIRCQNAWWGQRCDRIELRWQPGTEGYALAVRTMCDYGGRTELQLRLTQLWPVPEPADSVAPAAGAAPAADAELRD